MRRIPLVVAHLVGDAVAAAREGASRAGVTLTQRDGAPGAMIRGDAVRLGQVLTNLIGNAVRHTPSGGQVEVSWERRPGGGVRLVVSDTGEGVAAEHLPHLTERFYRVGGDRAIGEGRSGVGLTISKALVEAHGGRLAVDSPGLGGGTVVTVDLPDG